MVSRSTPRFPQQHFVLPSSVFWCILWGRGSPGDAAPLPSRAWVRSARRPRSLQASPRHRAKEKRGRRTIRNQRSHLHATGSRSPGGCSLCQHSLPSLLPQPMEGGAGLLPKIPLRGVLAIHPAMNKTRMDGEGTSLPRRKPFFFFPLFFLLSTGSDDGAGLEAALGMPIFRGWAHYTLLAGSSPSQPAPEENQVFSPAFLSSAALQEWTPRAGGGEGWHDVPPRVCFHPAGGSRSSLRRADSIYFGEGADV